MVEVKVVGRFGMNTAKIMMLGEGAGGFRGLEERKSITQNPENACGPLKSQPSGRHIDSGTHDTVKVPLVLLCYIISIVRSINYFCPKFIFFVGP